MAHTTYTSIKRKLGILIPFSLLFSFIAGCGSSQQEMMAQDNLRRARTAHKQAMVNPNVEAYAPVPLMDAGKAVQAAERAKNAKEMEHLAYVAEKKSQIAVTIAEGKMAERETERLGKETSEILLQKREQEAKLAKKEAEQAKLLALEKAAEAEKAKLEAETRTREAEQARMEAEAKARETERARMETAAKAREAEQARLLALAEAARAEKAKAEANQLLRELSNLKAKQTERGIVLTMGDVLFTIGKATISSEANRNIEKLVDFLQKYPNRNVLIEGHTDSVGKDEYNLALSEKRADAVKEQLVAKGIAEERITTKKYGRQYPVASNDSPAGRQQNRRVEVIILNEGVKPETQFRS